MATRISKKVGKKTRIAAKRGGKAGMPDMDEMREGQKSIEEKMAAMRKRGMKKRRRARRS